MLCKVVNNWSIFAFFAFLQYRKKLNFARVRSSLIEQKKKGNSVELKLV